MNQDFKSLRLAVTALIALTGSIFHISIAADESTLASPYVFTDDKAIVKIAGLSLRDELFYELKTITRQGFGPTWSGKVRVANSSIQIASLTEGVHILDLKSTPPQTLRFLAFAPPTRTDAKTLRRTIPQSYRKLLSGQPFKILSMGDSVTNTGDYESLLVKMLARATGNRNISFVDRSYPGRSIDASVRE